MASSCHDSKPGLVSTIPSPTDFRADYIIVLMPGQMVSAHEQVAVIATHYASATVILTSGQILRRPATIVGCYFDFFPGKEVSRQSASDIFRWF
jgi:hypothetical protein